MEAVVDLCTALILGVNIFARCAGLKQSLLCKALKLKRLGLVVCSLVANLLLGCEFLNSLKVLLALDL